MLITKKSVESFERHWYNIADGAQVQVIDLPDLKPETVGELIMDTAVTYRETFM